ncbi:MAG: MATE family efflux transporter [bacterium]
MTSNQDSRTNSSPSDEPVPERVVSAAEPVAVPVDQPSAPAGGIWRTVKEAIAGGEHDYTSIPLGRSVFLLAVPMVLEMMMESLFMICDAFFVSRLGVDALATVGLTEAMVTIVYAVAVGISLAVTAMVARRIGERNRAEANTATMQAIILGLLVALVIALPGAILAPQLLQLMGGSESLVASGSGYTRVILGGAATILLLFMINAAFRGAGDAAFAMRALWLANGINIVLDPCLIFGLGPFPELGLTGAAVATTIGRGCGVLFQLVMLGRGKGRLHITRADIRLRSDMMLRLVRVSLGGIGQYLISTSSWVILVRIVGTFGSNAVAGYTLAIRIIVFALLPSWGVCNAAATLMGQNLGAGQPDRAEKAVWRTGLYNMVFLVAIAVIFIVKADWLIRLFTDDPAVVAAGRSCLRLVSYGYGFYAYGMVIVQAFNGAGDTRTPTAINFFCYWCLQLPLAFVLSHHTGLAERGVFLAITLAEAVLALVGILVFRRGSWKSHQI